MANINTLQLAVGIAGSGTLADASNTINPASEVFQIGQQAAQFPGDLLLPSLVLTTGTGDGQGNQWYCGSRTLAATTYDLLNLDDVAAGLKNGLGQLIQLVKVKGFIIVIQAHDGVKVLQVGPQGQVNAWQGPFPNVLAAAYINVYWLAFIANDKGNGIGPGLDATHKILPVYNPTAGPITYSIFVVGNE